MLADISGFTALADALAAALGAQRGAEELTRHLNGVYGALIAEVDRYHGSVIGFSGDAITCWFDGSEEEAALRATTAAAAMQDAMTAFAEIRAPGSDVLRLAVKVAVASGPARRFRVGDPRVQYLDALAGATLDRLADAEHDAERGQVVLDERAATALAHAVVLRQGTRVVARLARRAAPAPWPPLTDADVSPESLRPWLLPPVYARLQAGQGDFLAELRPAVALFLRFGGIDFDADDAAGDKLDRFVRWVQHVLARYEGTLVDMTIGDKGSYLYCAFGAPTAHENDSERALRAALELRSPPANELAFSPPVQLGISRGRTRVGPFGGPTRRAYAVTGSEVNVAARLMQSAQPGQVLVSAHVFEGVRTPFVRRELAPLRVKGRDEPVRVVALEGLGERDADSATRETAPMIGRATELAAVVSALDKAAHGAGQVIGIVAEAGMGKSRLLAEAVRAARERGLAVHAGEAQAFGSMAAYLAWQGVFRGVFGVDAAAPVDQQARTVEEALASLDASLLPRLPLIGPVLGLPLPDNELTRQFDAKLRKDSLDALLATCLRATAARGPLILVVEDAHWLDPASAELLESLGRALAGMPVALVTTCRPTDREGKPALARVAALPHFTELALHELNRDDAATLIARAARARFGEATPVPDAFIEMLLARAERNPFLAEELVEYLHDRGIRPDAAVALASLDLPSSLAGAILGRIDRLTMTQQTTLRVASVIGRSYPTDWLWGVHPELGDHARVAGDLQALAKLDLVQTDGGARWTFRHSMIQEVAYESLPFASREKLHEQLASWLERGGGGDAGEQLDGLAFHYGRSTNRGKQREYFRKAGDAAAGRYANDAAAEYYGRLVELLDGRERASALLSLGAARQHVSRWDDAEKHYLAALDAGQDAASGDVRARCCLALGAICSQRAAFDKALAWYEKAREEYATSGDRPGEAAAAIESANTYRLQGKLDVARAILEKSLQDEGDAGDKPRIARACQILGNVFTARGEFAQSRATLARSLRIRRDLGDRPGTAIMLANIAVPTYLERRLDEARTYLLEAQALCDELGMRWESTRATQLLAMTFAEQGQLEAAREMFARNLVALRDLGALRELAELLLSMLLTWRAGMDARQVTRALLIGGAGQRLSETLGSPMPPPLLKQVDARRVELAEYLGADVADSSWSTGRGMAWADAVSLALAETA